MTSASWVIYLPFSPLDVPLLLLHSGPGDANARRDLRDELQLLGIQVSADQGPPLERRFPVEDAPRGVLFINSRAFLVTVF